MTDQSVPSRLQTLFELALRDYETHTKISLAEHPLAQKLEDCHSIESITTLLQDQARSFGEFRARDRMTKSIKSTTSFLYKLSAIAALGDDMGLVRQKTPMSVFHVSDIIPQAFPPAKALYTGIGVLLAVCLSSDSTSRIRYDIRMHQAANGVVDTYDALVDMLEAIEHFLKRLDIYTEIPSTPEMDEIIVKIMVELLSTLGLATKELEQGRSSESCLADILYITQRNAEEFIQGTFGGDKHTEAILQRLDRLTANEARTTAAEILKVVYGLVQDMSKQTFHTRLSPAIEYHSG